MIRKLGEAQLGSYYWICSRISRKQVAWELAAPGSPVPESFLCPTWSLFFQQVSWACSYGSWAGIQKKPAVACKKAQHCVTKSLIGKKSPGNSDSGETERLGFNGTHSNSKIKRNRHRKNKRVAVSWYIKVRQRNKAEWEFCTKAEAKDHCFVSINLCTYIPMLLYITFETWTNFDPFHFFTGVLLFWFLSCFVLFLSQIHWSFTFVFVLFCFLAFLNSPPTYSLTPRSALFRLGVSFILPQSLLSGLLSIPESGRNQGNEENTQSFGSMKKQWDANFYQARGHLNPKCWKS